MQNNGFFQDSKIPHVSTSTQLADIMTTPLSSSAFQDFRNKLKVVLLICIFNFMKEPIKFASLIWDDGEYQVRSPIVVYDKQAEKDVKAPNLIQVVIIIAVVFIILLILIFVKYRHLYFICSPCILLFH